MILAQKKPAKLIEVFGTNVGVKNDLLLSLTGIFPPFSQTGTHDNTQEELSHDFSFDLSIGFRGFSKDTFVYLEEHAVSHLDEELQHILLHGDLDFETEMSLLFDKMQKVRELIKIYLNKGHTVISSFSEASIFAYMYGRWGGSLESFIKVFPDKVKKPDPSPTMYVFLTMSPEMAFEKFHIEMGKSLLLTKFDIDFFKKVNEGFFAFSKYVRRRTVYADASKPINTITGVVEEGIKKHLIQD